MKKIAASITALTSFLVLAKTAFAQVEINIKKPAQGIDPGTEPGIIIGNLITIIFVVAVLLVLFFMIYGAFRWITSGGEKEAVGAARGTILNALIGLAVLGVAFLIANLAAGIFGFDLNALRLPKIDEP